MEIWERYSKEIIEKFAINVVAKSFNKKYSTYFSPENSDNFDFISPDETEALEVTLVIPDNEQREYIYEREKHKGKKDLKTNHIKNANFDSQGNIISYYGGSMPEIKNAILDSLERKQQKACKRLKDKNYQNIDLCFCIQDGSLFDLFSFKIAFDNLDKYIFQNIFFITPSYFIRYNKKVGFKEYPRKY